MTSSPFECLLNFRDAGESVNQAMGHNVVQVGKLYRGARPDGATSADRNSFEQDWGIKTIVDLRSKTELIEAATKHDARVRSSSLNPQSKEDVVEPLQMPGINYRMIDFNGSMFQRKLLSQLSWYSYLRMIGLYVTGYRLQAISIPCREVLQPGGLIGLAINSIDACQDEVLEVFKVLAESESYPVMLHCTQGKDRTGISIALVMFLLGVSVEAVTADYIKSEKALEVEWEERMKEIRSIGLDEHFTTCPPDLIAQVHDHIVNQYGSVEQYLEGCGVTEEMQEKVKAVLTA